MDPQAHYLQQFASTANARSVEPRWLASKREAGFAEFQRLGFPSQKLEDWKYTNIREIAETAFGLATRKTVEAALPSIREALETYFFSDGLRLVFVNGIFLPELSVTNPSQKGLVLESLLGACTHDTGRLIEENLGRHLPSDFSGFSALNTALFQDGAFVHLAHGTRIETPIQILHLAFGADADIACFPRNLYLLEPDSRATILETFVSLGGAHSFCDAVTEIVVSRGARLDQIRIQNETQNALHISATQLQQDAASQFQSIAIALTGKLTRSDLRSALLAEGAECKLSGLYAAHERHVVDHHILVTHEKPHCTSVGYYKGILADQSRGVFKGRVIVQPNAQKTSSMQSNKNLLLSDGAEIDSKPELIIHADDVKCSHGSTTGSLNEDSLFYLRSRGISKADAKTLLTRAFAAEITAQLPCERLRERVDSWLADYFAKQFLSDGKSVTDRSGERT